MFIRRRKFILIILSLCALWVIVNSLLGHISKTDTTKQNSASGKRSVGAVGGGGGNSAQKHAQPKESDLYYEDEGEVIEVPEDVKPTRRHHPGFEVESAMKGEIGDAYKQKNVQWERNEGVMQHKEEANENEVDRHWAKKVKNREEDFGAKRKEDLGAIGKKNDVERYDDNEEVNIENVREELHHKKANTDWQENKIKVLQNDDVDVANFKKSLDKQWTGRPTDMQPVTLAEQPLFVDSGYVKTPAKYNPASKIPPGFNGSAVIIDESQLSEADKKRMEEGWKKHAHNEFVSRMISLQRELPDVRAYDCKMIGYGEGLPAASIIIVFHNEAWTTLLRTIHSIFNRSPTYLIHEIILIDDNSDEAHLQQQLDDYVALLPKIHLYRLPSRLGVIRARQKGALAATGKVLVFLDSHCECTVGWLEPLLARISYNRTIVAMPVMDIIDDTTFEYKTFDIQSINIGGFDWNLQFAWISVPDREKQRRPMATDPIRSPTMSGGMYAISRSTFTKLGGYDTGMDMWGAENLEMSFRVWMCGGSLEMVPCSHVGHVFRRRTTYQLRGDAGSSTNPRKNFFRVAEVWMDDYKNHFYEKIGGRPKIDETVFGDLTKRKRLRKHLQCQSFDWYLKNIYPELFIPANALASGDIRSRDRSYIDKNGYPACIDSIVGPNAYNQPINVWPCHGQGGNQYWLLSPMGEIRRDDGCLDYAGKSVVIYPCHGQRGNQEWEYLKDGTVRHHSTHLCLSLSTDGSSLSMLRCVEGAENQLWQWKQSSVGGSVDSEASALNVAAGDEKQHSLKITPNPQRSRRPKPVNQEIAIAAY